LENPTKYHLEQISRKQNLVHDEPTIQSTDVSRPIETFEITRKFSLLVASTNSTRGILARQ